MEVDRLKFTTKSKTMERFVVTAPSIYALEGPGDIGVTLNHLFGVFPERRGGGRHVVYANYEKLDSHTQLFFRVLNFSPAYFSPTAFDADNDAPIGPPTRRGLVLPLGVLSLGKTDDTDQDSTLLFCAAGIHPALVLGEIKVVVNNRIKEIARVN